MFSSRECFQMACSVLGNSICFLYLKLRFWFYLKLVTELLTCIVRYHALEFVVKLSCCSCYWRAERRKRGRGEIAAFFVMLRLSYIQQWEGVYASLSSGDHLNFHFSCIHIESITWIQSTVELRIIGTQNSGKPRISGQLPKDQLFIK